MIVDSHLTDNNTVLEVREVLLCDAADVKPTSEGYLVATPRIARAGIQLYRGAEVGRPDIAWVRCYRPAEEVFHTDSLKTLAHRPITLDHPKGEMVHAKNWRKYAVGSSGNDVIRDGEFIRVPMTLQDHAAIEAFKAGKKQLSVGYTSHLKWEAGVTDSGEPYDLLQTQIRANHIALCDSARGGDSLILGDDNGDDQMTTRKVMLDGFEVEVVDSQASIVTRTFEKLTADLKTAEQKLADSEKANGALQTQLADAKGETEKKVGEIAALNQKLKDSEIKPEKLDELVKGRMVVYSKAKAVLGDSASLDGKSDVEIRKLVVAKQLGDETVKTMSDAAIEGAFAVIAAKAPAQGGGGSHGLHDNLSMHLSGPGVMTEITDGDKAREEAYERRRKLQNEAWRHAGNGKAA